NVFVGRFGYPNVNVGLLSSEEKDDNLDNPLKWSREEYGFNRIANLRSSLVNSRFRSTIAAPRTAKEKLNDLAKEISLSQKTVDTEIHLKDMPRFRLSFQGEASPHGPAVPLAKATITENVRIPTKVDKAVSDPDYKASDALNDLYRHHFDEHYLTKVLSVGNLGVRTQRKLVPTRWSITAVDDSLGKGLLDDVKRYTNHVSHEAYFAEYLGNYFLALFFPGNWSYEFIENFTFDMEAENPAAGVSSESDSEGFSGRRSYAQETAGGYYAARLPVLEFLNKRKRQGSVMLMRFITTDYYASLGVWVVRETVRKTLAKKPLEFGCEELMLLYAKKLIRRRFNYDISLLIARSRLMQAKKQKTLGEF
ncbi:MAG: hypothetical protein ACOC32_04150, partial [Nanoarchaeota archaeon]